MGRTPSTSLQQRQLFFFLAANPFDRWYVSEEQSSPQKQPAINKIELFLAAPFDGVWNFYRIESYHARPITRSVCIRSSNKKLKGTSQ